MKTSFSENYTYLNTSSPNKRLSFLKENSFLRKSFVQFEETSLLQIEQFLWKTSLFMKKRRYHEKLYCFKKKRKYRFSKRTF